MLRSILFPLSEAIRLQYLSLQRQLIGPCDTCDETLHGIKHLLRRWSTPTVERQHLEQLGHAIDELTDRIVEEGDRTPPEQRLQLMRLRTHLLQLFYATRMGADGQRRSHFLDRAQGVLTSVTTRPEASLHLLN